MLNIYGFVKFFRDIINAEWHEQKSSDIVFFGYLYLFANIEDRIEAGYTIRRGSLKTTKKEISELLNLSIQNIRTLISKFEKAGILTTKNIARGTIFTLVYYDDYVEYNTFVNSKITTKQQSNNKCIKEKEINNINNKNTFVSPTLQEISEYIHENNFLVVPEEFLDHYISVGWKVGKNRMVDWKASIREWNRRIQNQGKSNTAAKGKNNFNNYDNQRNYSNSDFVDLEKRYLC